MMIIGMSVPAFTLLHVLISLVAIASGLVVILGMLAFQRDGAGTIRRIVERRESSDIVRDRIG